MKAEWRKYDWSKSPHPEREGDYALYEELVHPDRGVIATIEAFASYPEVFYGNTSQERSGAIASYVLIGGLTSIAYDRARQWCEAKTGNLVN